MADHVSTVERDRRSSDVKELTRDQVAQLRAVFTMLDMDNQGSLTKEDALSAARMLGSPLSPFSHIPEDHLVSFDQFVACMQAGTNLDPRLQPFEAALNQFFESVDSEGRGYITKKQLARFFSETGVKAQVSTPAQVASLT